MHDLFRDLADWKLVLFHWKFLICRKIFFGEKVRATNIFYDSGFFSHWKNLPTNSLVV